MHLANPTESSLRHEFDCFTHTIFFLKIIFNDLLT